MIQKKCLKCHRVAHEKDNFCGNCGEKLPNMKEAFLLHKKEVKRKFIADCSERAGTTFGCNKLSEAAWFIATNAPGVYDYLQGEKIGEVSYGYLEDASGDALEIFDMICAAKDACWNATSVEKVDSAKATVFFFYD